MIGYPSWFQGSGFPDVERVMRDFFAGQLTGVQVVSWMPPDYAGTLAAGGAYLRVFRMGGQIDPDGRIDEARVQFAALSASRDASVGLIDFVRSTLLLAFRYGQTVNTNGTTAFVTCPGEVVGPQLVPEQLRDERLIVTTLSIHVDRRRGLPDYARQIFT